MDAYEKQLRILSVYFYVLAAFGIVLFGIALGNNLPLPNLPAGTPVPPAWLIILSLLFMSVSYGFTGYALSQHKYYAYCLVMGAVSCFNIPIGTLFGVWTLVLLTREPVKNRFQQPPLTH